MPYNGKIVIVERGGCTFEEKAVNAQDGGAVGVIIVNNDVSSCYLRCQSLWSSHYYFYFHVPKQNSIFYMASSQTKVVDLQENSGGDVDNIFKKLKESLAGFQQNNLMLNNAEEISSSLNEEIENQVESKSPESFLKTMTTAMSAMTSQAFGSFTKFMQTSRPVIIPAVMVSQDYGRALLSAYQHMKNKKLSVRVSLETDTKHMSLDDTVNEGTI